uniref:Serpentine receptor class gamma n=1 Tax=Acrobeloides nanus TaxID=290746 RepID=A0A914EPJ4_9BILA
MTSIFLLIIAIACFCSTIPMIFGRIGVLHVPFPVNNNTIYIYSGPTFFDSSYLDAYRLGWKVQVYAIIFTGICIYPIIIWKVYKSLHIPGQLNNNNLNHELKILYSALLLFLVNLIYTAYFVFRDNIIAMFPSLSATALWGLYIVGDIYDMYNAYSILITSKEIRASVRDVIVLRSMRCPTLYNISVVTPN